MRDIWKLLREGEHETITRVKVLYETRGRSKNCTLLKESKIKDTILLDNNAPTFF